jgi:hypothetical protein
MNEKNGLNFWNRIKNSTIRGIGSRVNLGTFRAYTIQIHWLFLNLLLRYLKVNVSIQDFLFFEVTIEEQAKAFEKVRNEIYGKYMGWIMEQSLV